MSELQNTAPGTPAPNGSKYHLVYHFETRTAFEGYTKGVDLEMVFQYFPDESEIQDKIYEYILANNMWQLVPGSILFKSVWVEDN